jgi:hypothetical protein
LQKKVIVKQLWLLLRIKRGIVPKIENNSTSKYAKLKLDYRYGLGTIYDRMFIEKKKLEPEFE